MQNILILDNDECLGYFGLLNGIYNGCIRILFHNRLHNNGIDIDILNEFNTIFTDLSIELLNAGYARKGLTPFFENIKKLKSHGHIHKVVMMTSNYRYIKNKYMGYFDWVKTIRTIFEKYANIDTQFPTISIYDLDYSCRTDEVNAIVTKDKATKKVISKIIDKLQITDYTTINKIVCIDDRIKNIDFDDIFDIVRVILQPVRSYYSLISKTLFYTIINKYEERLLSLHINSFKDICILNYNHDVIEMGIHGNKLFTNIKNDSDLDIDLYEIFNK